MKKILLRSAFLLCAAAVLAGCQPRSSEGRSDPTSNEGQTSDQVSISAKSARDLGITLFTVQRKSSQRNLTVPARLLASQDREAIVGTLLQGRVRRVQVNVGDHVQKGQELMLIEGLEIGEIKAAFIKARANLRYAEAAVKRQRVLHEQNIGSEKVYLEAEAEYQKARAESAAEDRKIHSVGLSDADVEQFIDAGGDSASSHVGGLLPIRAPLSGVVAERNVIQGQLVDATTNAFRVVETGLLWADGQIQEQDLNGKIEGGPARLTVTAMPGREFDGTIIFVSPVVDPQTRTVTVRAAVPNPGGVLKPNMFGELRFAAGQRRNVMLVPGEAVARIRDSAYVFVNLNDTLYARRKVTLGMVDGDDVEVIGGVREGERVVSNGSFILKSEHLKDALGEEE